MVIQCIKPSYNYNCCRPLLYGVVGVPKNADPTEKSGPKGLLFVTRCYCEHKLHIVAQKNTCLHTQNSTVYQ